MKQYPTGIKLNIEDLYHGLYIQSAGNAEYVYKVHKLTDAINDEYGYKLAGKYYLTTSHMIVVDKMNEDTIPFNQHKVYTIKDVEMLKTPLTDKLNRENKLNSLINEGV
jgi:hypothetical protein